MDGKVLGKIKEIDIIEEYGHILLFVELSGEDWGVQNSYPIIPGLKAKNPSEWKIFPLAEYMQAAKVNHLAKMRGTPVEATFDRDILKSWRILTEVI